MKPFIPSKSIRNPPVVEQCVEPGMHRRGALSRLLTRRANKRVAGVMKRFMSSSSQTLRKCTIAVHPLHLSSGFATHATALEQMSHLIVCATGFMRMNFPRRISEESAGPVHGILLLLTLHPETSTAIFCAMPSCRLAYRNRRTIAAGPDSAHEGQAWERCSEQLLQAIVLLLFSQPVRLPRQRQTSCADCSSP